MYCRASSNCKVHSTICISENLFPDCVYSTILLSRSPPYSTMKQQHAIQHSHLLSSTLQLGTCESFCFRSNRISNRIGRPIRFRIEYSNRISRCNQTTVVYTLVYTYSEYLIHRYFVFVTNESDVRTTELRTEYLFISIQS